MKMKYLKASIVFLISCIVVNFIKAYEIILKNKVSMLQMKNDNTSYLIYTLYKDNKNLIIFVIVVIATLSIYRIFNKGEKKNE